MNPWSWLDKFWPSMIMIQNYPGVIRPYILQSSTVNAKTVLSRIRAPSASGGRGRDEFSAFGCKQWLGLSLPASRALYDGKKWEQKYIGKFLKFYQTLNTIYLHTSRKLHDIAAASPRHTHNLVRRHYINRSYCMFIQEMTKYFLIKSSSGLT